MGYFRIVFLMMFAFLWVLPGQVFAGKITGTVVVKGLRSPEDVLVYVSNAPSGSKDLSQVEFVMDQRNLAFIPHVLPVLVGSRVHFPNNDKVNHNVFSLSQAKQFNLGSYKTGESKTVLFDKPGIIEMRCDVHAEMAAYIIVLKNPYWAVTDSQGRFEIPDSESLSRHGLKGVKELPPGKVLLKTWHEKLKNGKMTVEIPADGKVELKLDLSRGIPGVLYK
ncbi:MAG: hypothetical protein ABII06_13235 [Pseudomonadota bacterium]